jgi:hypothetical protein
VLWVDALVLPSLLAVQRERLEQQRQAQQRPDRLRH